MGVPWTAFILLRMRGGFATFSFCRPSTPAETDCTHFRLGIFSQTASGVSRPQASSTSPSMGSARNSSSLLYQRTTPSLLASRRTLMCSSFITMGWAGQSE